MIRNRILHAVHDELDALLNLGQLLWQSRLAQLHPRTSLVNQIDRLIRKETVGNIPAGMRDREGDRVVGIADGVELLILLADAHEDLYGIFFIRWRNLHGLEAPLQRAVLLDRLPILRRRRRPDALDLAAAQRRLQNVRCIQRTLRRPCTHQRMQFVDEDDAVLVLHQLLHDGLEPFFKLPAILRSRNDQREIERKHALLREEARNLAVGDLLRQPFDDRRLANARLTDQHWIILRPAAEDLDDALNFKVASHQRIELLIGSGLRQVARELRQHGLLLRVAALLAAAGLRRGFFLRRTLQLLADRRQPQSTLGQNLRCEALLLAQQSEQQVLRSNVFVAQPLGLFSRIGQDAFALIR